MSKKGPAAGKVLETDDVSAIFGLDMAGTVTAVEAGGDAQTAAGQPVTRAGTVRRQPQGFTAKRLQRRFENDPPQRALIQTRRPEKGGRTQAGCGGGAEGCHGSRPGASREDIRAPGRCAGEEDGCEEEWRLCQLSRQSGFRGEGARTTAGEVVVAEQSSESTPIMICWPAWPAEDLETSDRYIAVPHKNELGLGRDLALSFIDRELPGDYKIPRQGFSEEGRDYGRFKQLLQSRSMLQRWYDFESSATEEALRAWCEENGIQVVGA